jgi:hypothetical protein
MKNYIRESIIRNKIRNLLLEAVIDDLISKSKREEEEWRQFESILVDSGVQKNSSTIGNYLKWAFKHVSENSEESLIHVANVIYTFHELKNKPSKWKIINNHGEFEKLSQDIFSFNRESLGIAIETVNKTDLNYIEKKPDKDNGYGANPAAIVDKWEIYFPTNIPESIEVASRGTKVSWCTARKTNNLFYAYALSNTFLFYVLDADNPANKYCIGVAQGKVIPGEPGDGGATVDMHNNGFMDNHQTRVFGGDIMQQIHKKMIDITTKFNNVHPGRKIALTAMSNLKTWKQLIGSWSKDNRNDLITLWFKGGKNVYEPGCMCEDVFHHILYQSDYYIPNDPCFASHQGNVNFVYKKYFSEFPDSFNAYVHALKDIESWKHTVDKWSKKRRANFSIYLIENVKNINNIDMSDKIPHEIYQDIFKNHDVYYDIRKEEITDSLTYQLLNFNRKLFDNHAKTLLNINTWKRFFDDWGHNYVYHFLNVLSKHELLRNSDFTNIIPTNVYKHILDNFEYSHSHYLYILFDKLYKTNNNSFISELRSAINSIDSWREYLNNPNLGIKDRAQSITILVDSFDKLYDGKNHETIDEILAYTLGNPLKFMITFDPYSLGYQQLLNLYFVKLGNIEDVRRKARHVSSFDDYFSKFGNDGSYVKYSFLKSDILFHDSMNEEEVKNIDKKIVENIIIWYNSLYQNVNKANRYLNNKDKNEIAASASNDPLLHKFKYIYSKHFIPIDLEVNVYYDIMRNRSWGVRTKNMRENNKFKAQLDKDIKTKENILKDFNQWINKIDNNKVPSKVIVDLFDDVFLYSQLTDIEQFDYRAMEKLTSAAKHVFEAHLQANLHREKTKVYVSRYLIARNGGMDINLFKNIASDSQNIKYLLKHIFLNDKNYCTHVYKYENSRCNLYGKGVISLNVYKYILDNLLDFDLSSKFVFDNSINKSLLLEQIEEYFIADNFDKNIKSQIQNQILELKINILKSQSEDEDFDE